MKCFRLFTVIIAAAVILLSSCNGVRTNEQRLDVTFGLARELRFNFNSTEYELLVIREGNKTSITVLGEGTLAGTVIDVFETECIIKQNGIEIITELSALPGDTFYSILSDVIGDISNKNPAFIKNEAGIYEYFGNCGEYSYKVTADGEGVLTEIRAVTQTEQ